MTDTVTYSVLQNELHLFDTSILNPAQSLGLGMTAVAFVMRRLMHRINRRQPMLTDESLENSGSLNRTIDSILQEIGTTFSTLGVQNDYVRGRVQELLDQLGHTSEAGPSGARPRAELIEQITELGNTLLGRLQRANYVIDGQQSLVQRLISLSQFEGCDCASNTTHNLLSDGLVDHIADLLNRPASRISVSHTHSHSIASAEQVPTAALQAQADMNRLSVAIDGGRVTQSALLPASRSQSRSQASAGSASVSDSVSMLEEDFEADADGQLQALQSDIEAMKMTAATQARSIADLMTEKSITEHRLQDAFLQLNQVNFALDRQSNLVLQLSHIVHFDIVQKSELVVRHLLTQQLVQCVSDNFQQLERDNHEAHARLKQLSEELSEVRGCVANQEKELTERNRLLQVAEETLRHQSTLVQQFITILVSLDVSVSMDSDLNSSRVLLRQDMLDALRMQLHSQHEELLRIQRVSQESTGQLDDDMRRLLQQLGDSNELLRHHERFVRRLDSMTGYTDGASSPQQNEMYLNALLQHVENVLANTRLENESLRFDVSTHNTTIVNLQVQLEGRESELEARRSQLQRQEEVLAAEEVLATRLATIVGFEQLSSGISYLSEPLLVHVDDRMRTLRAEAQSSMESANALSGELVLLKESLDAQSAERHIMDKELVVVKTALSKARNDLANEQMKSGEYCKEIGSLKESLQEAVKLNAETDEIRKELDAVQAEHEDLVDRFTAIEASNVELQETLSGKDEIITELDQMVITMRDEASNIFQEQAQLVRDLCEIVGFDMESMFDQDLPESERDFPLLTGSLIDHIRQLLELNRSQTPTRGLGAYPEKMSQSVSSVRTDGDVSTVATPNLERDHLNTSGLDTWSGANSSIQSPPAVGSLSPARGTPRVTSGSADIVMDSRSQPQKSLPPSVFSFEEQIPVVESHSGDDTPLETASGKSDTGSKKIPYYKSGSASLDDGGDHRAHHRNHRKHSHSHTLSTNDGHGQENGIAFNDAQSFVVNFDDMSSPLSSSSLTGDARLGSQAGRLSSEEYLKSFSVMTPSKDLKDEEFFKIVALQTDIPAAKNM